MSCFYRGAKHSFATHQGILGTSLLKCLVYERALAELPSCTQWHRVKYSVEALQTSPSSRFGRKNVINSKRREMSSAHRTNIFHAQPPLQATRMKSMMTRCQAIRSQRRPIPIPVHPQRLFLLFR